MSGAGICFGTSRWMMLGTSSLSPPLLLLPLCHGAAFFHLQASAPIHNSGESRGFISRTYATSRHETGCAGTNTLMGFCSNSRVLGDNWLSRTVLGLGSCPPRGLQEPASAGAWQRPGCFSAPARGGGDLAGDILGLKRTSPPTRTWLSPINAARAWAAATRVRPSIHPCPLSSSSGPGTRWPFGSVVLGKVSTGINL